MLGLGVDWSHVPLILLFHVAAGVTLSWISHARRDEALVGSKHENPGPLARANLRLLSPLFATREQAGEWRRRPCVELRVFYALRIYGVSLLPVRVPWLSRGGAGSSTLPRPARHATEHDQVRYLPSHLLTCDALYGVRVGALVGCGHRLQRRAKR